MQGIKVDVLDGRLPVLARGRVLARAALGLAHPQPIGSLITGAREAIALNEGFQQINRMRVFALPIGAQTTGHPA